MSEREEHQEELVDDVEVGNVEVVLQRGEVDPSVDLIYRQSASMPMLCLMPLSSRRIPTFCSKYSWPCLKAFWPICAAICVVGSLMKLPYCPNTFPPGCPGVG